MAKDKLTDYSATNASNTDVGGINIDEGMQPSAVNDAIREVMTHLKDFSDGTSGVDVLNLQDDDASASIKIQAPATVTTTTTFTLPDGDGTSGQVLQTSGTGTLSWTSNGLANVVEDTTPALGGNLDLNGNNITGTGNISTTGTATFTGDLTVDTNTLYVDSTNNRVGIGVSSPAHPLSVENPDGNTNTISMINNSSNLSRLAFVQNGSTTAAYSSIDADGRSTGFIRFNTNDAEAMRIDSSGKVGIATSSMTYNLNVESSAGEWLYLTRSGGATYKTNASGSAVFLGTVNSYPLVFQTNNSEAARIDTSGNLLVGTTTNLTGAQVSAGTTGIALRGDSDQIVVAADGGISGIFNRNTSDGQVILVQKGGTDVGAIGTNGNRLYVSGPDAGGIKFDQYGATNGAPLPCTSTGAKADNLHDFGVSDARWDDIYATNGTIQTSDQNEKQQIASLTDAEITAAKAISQLFKTFKWNDKVAAKGDAARRHTGVVAQDVEAAMTAAGLDAGDYAFFISTTWWEADGETYYNADDAPEGATEHNRKGIRYPELLSFVGAATEQRLANIETRLAALEAN